MSGTGATRKATAPWTASGTLDAPGGALEYACLGPQPDEAPTLVLLHEGLGCTRLWRDVPEALARATGFGACVFSRAGYGHSDPVALPRPLDYMNREAIEVLPAVLEAFGVRRAVLVGHSDGATIAAVHVGRVVDSRVIGAVLMAPHFFTEAAGLVEIAKAREAFETGDLRIRLAKYHRDPDVAFRGWNDAWLDPAFDVGRAVDALGDIRVPVLAIQGRDDPYGTLDQIEAVTRDVRRAVVSTLILDGCRHAPHLERGPETIAAIATFCERAASVPPDARASGSATGRASDPMTARR